MDKLRFAASKNSRNATYQFWQHNNHAEELISNKYQEQKLHYIPQNPVLDGWVEEAYYYLYSNARDYTGLSGLIPIMFLE